MLIKPLLQHPVGPIAQEWCLLLYKMTQSLTSVIYCFSNAALCDRMPIPHLTENIHTRESCFTLPVLVRQMPITVPIHCQLWQKTDVFFFQQHKDIRALTAIQLQRCLWQVCCSHQLRQSGSDKEYRCIYFKGINRFWYIFLTLT